MISFTEALLQDAAFLSEMRRLVWLSTYRGIYPDRMLDDFDYAFHNEKNLSMINSPDYFVYFILYGERRVGYLILQKKYPLYVQSLYLLEDFRRKGIGRGTFDFIRGFCRKNGIEDFYLTCHPENKNALAFYDKMGGKITARDEGHLNNSENNVRISFTV